MAEVVDAEGHLETVGSGFRSRDHLDAGVAHDGVQRWQVRRGPHVVHERPDRSQGGQVAFDDGAALRLAKRRDRLGAALWAADRQDDVPGLVASEKCTGTFESEPGAGSGDDCGLHGHCSSRSTGMRAATA
jgi:hypothetical protein